MAETNPTPSGFSAPPEVGEHLRVTFQHATSEIDVVPVSAITNYPAFPNDDSDVLPPGLDIYAAPTEAITGRTFQDYCALYLAAGSGTFTLLELGRAVEIPFLNVWQTVRRLHKTLPEQVLAVEPNEPLIRKRKVTLGNVAVAEVQRAFEPEELEARQEHRREMDEAQIAAHQRQAMHRQKPKILELQYREREKRQLDSYNHVVITIGDSGIRLDLTTLEGRLTFRYIESMKKLTAGVPIGSGNRRIAMRDIRAEAWKNMTIAERLNYATEIEQLYSGKGSFMDEFFTHVGEYLHQVKPNGARPITMPRDQTTLLFTNPPIKLAFSERPPKETSSIPPLDIPSFPEGIAEKLPKTPIAIPDFSPLRVQRRGYRS